MFARWVGPDGIAVRIEHWDARTGGSWRYVARSRGEDHGFRGTFHEVRPDRIVQTFTWEGMPDRGQPGLRQARRDARRRRGLSAFGVRVATPTAPSSARGAAIYYHLSRSNPNR
ncbi:MAG: SRPBCC domain-containing protein [Pseudonocardia sp.]